MAKKVFKSDLSVKGIENLKKQLINYRDVILITRCQEYVAALINMGVEVAQAHINEAPLGKYVTLSTNISADAMGCKGILIAVGEVKKSEGYEDFDTLLAIEFGAGSYYNKNPNPNADKFGLGVGTFPGQMHAFEDGWYFWDDKNEKWQYTHGVKATMPMYNADTQILTQYVDLAKRIFGRRL